MGADRIVNILGALDRYPGDDIVVDFGHRDHLRCVTADHVFIGESIMPGSARRPTSWCARRRSSRRRNWVRRRAPSAAPTEEHVQGGVLFGAASSVDGMVRRLRAEWPGAGTGNRERGTRSRVVATGGLSVVVAPLCTSVDVVDADLTLHGLELRRAPRRAPTGERGGKLRAGAGLQAAAVPRLDYLLSSSARRVTDNGRSPRCLERSPGAGRRARSIG